MYWELELESLEDTSMLAVFETQMQEANVQFAKFIEDYQQQQIMQQKEAIINDLKRRI